MIQITVPCTFIFLIILYRYEGRIGARRGIFPATYVDVSVEPGETRRDTGKF